MTRADLLDETFDALVFDWDGTAVPDRHADASRLCQQIQELSAAGTHIFLVSGTHVGNVDGQLHARPRGPGRLFLCLNRGSEVFAVTSDGPVLVSRRTATPDEEIALDRSAENTVARLGQIGLHAALVERRLNRRKIDLIPIAQWSDPKKRDIAALLTAVEDRLAASGVESLTQVVALAREESRAAGLSDPRITSDVKHVEIGLTDKSDSGRWAAGWLEERGLTGRLVFIGGDEFGPVGGVPGSDSLMVVSELARAVVASVGVEPSGVPDGVLHLRGGPRWFGRLLDAQIGRRAAKRIPQIDHDPGWVLHLPQDPKLERVAESIGTLSNGWVGVRASKEEGPASTLPMTVNGVFENDRLLPGPSWTDLSGGADAPWTAGERVLDMRTGVLARYSTDRRGPRSIRFVSNAQPSALAMRVEATGQGWEARGGPRPGVSREVRGAIVTDTTGTADRRLAVASRDQRVPAGQCLTLDRLAGWAVGAAPEVSAMANQRLAAAQRDGFDGLLAAHRESWAARWADAKVVIEGSPDDELAARFALFHLLSSAPDHGEAAVGARGLTGEDDAGHVLWDADVSVLPALAAIHPPAARAMLEYRIRRLPAARAEARRRHLRGARFPWESADNGADVSARLVHDDSGRTTPILTGSHEEHIVADVAWGAAQYVAWSGDTAFFTSSGRALLTETARYWASRIQVDSAGRGHLYRVIGPDEYHTAADDNAYTNVMARWNLRRGAALLSPAPGRDEEAARWLALADGLVDGWDPTRGLYEQFSGYFDLEPLTMEQVATPPVAVDVLLGSDRVARSQLVKQPDVLMLHHLLPGETREGSLKTCLDFYGPRTAHGSPLSPAIHASLLARAGQPNQALELFRVATRIDLDDLTGTTGGGLHLAAMGGVWQALAYGFLGLSAEGEALRVDPCLPDQWTALSMRLVYQGQRVEIRALPDRVVVTSDTPFRVRLGGGTLQECQPPRTELVRQPRVDEDDRLGCGSPPRTHRGRTAASSHAGS